MTRFFSEKGSVSVFFMIILSVLVFFNGVLIDFARIKAAEKESEQALRAAMRSVLSRFDSTLLDYGLFGVEDVRQAQEIFTDVLQQHVLVDGDGEFMQIVQPVWQMESLEFEAKYSLGHHEVFKRQVMEEMKYKAPIEFVLDIYDKWNKSGLVDEIEGASEFVKWSEEIEKLIQKREKSLQRAWDMFVQIVGTNGQMAQFHGIYEQKLHSMGEIARKIGDYEKEDLQKQILSKEQELLQLELQLQSTEDETEVDRLQQTIQLVKDQLRKLRELLDLFMQFVSLVLETKQSIERSYQTLIALQDKWLEHLSEAKQYNDALIEEMEKWKLQAQENGHFLHDSTKVLFEQMEVLDRDYFVQYELGISTTIGLFSGFRSLFDSVSLIRGSDFEKRYENLVAANNAYFEEANQLYAKQKSLEEHRKSKYQQIEQEQEEEKKEIQGLIQRVKDLVSDCDSDDSASYELLKATTQKYLDFNEMVLHDESRDMIDLEPSEQLGKNALRWGEMIRSSLTSIQDKVYLNEYALNKFNYRTFDSSYELSHSSPHLLANQEAEYILYGFHSCVANHSAAYAEIFSLRLAIRTFEALIKPENAAVSRGSPILFFLKAVADGARQAYQDMLRLLKGEEVVLSDRLPRAITLNYKDYLRLFMFVHGREHKMIARMQALIELNTKRDLLEKPTAIHVRITANERLWFIPAVMRIMNQDVTGRHVNMAKTLEISY